MPVSEHPHCFPSYQLTGPIHLSKRSGTFFNRLSSCLRARLAPARAHSSHYLKNRTKLTPIRDSEAKKTSIRSEMLCKRSEWQNFRHCCRRDRTAYCRRGRPGRHAGGGPLQTARKTLPRGGAYATALPYYPMIFLRGKTTWIKSSTQPPRPPTRCCASSRRKPRSRNSVSTSAA
ncbi:hypothetical protein EMIT0111MI5_250072 [Burkholderia sp. IT-111MI5]